MIRRIQRLVELRQQSPELQNCIVGLHIEGPFINPADGYRGAHLAMQYKWLRLMLCKRLLEAGAGLIKMVTLAPEADPVFVVINYLTEQRIAIAAGHTDCFSRTYYAARSSMDLSYLLIWAMVVRSNCRDMTISFSAC